MKKSLLCFLVVFLVIGVSSVFAQTFRPGTYALPNTDITMRFNGSSTSGRIHLDGWSNAGTYNVSGDRIVIRMNSTTDRSYRELSNVTLELTVDSKGDIWDGSARWIRVGG